MNIIKENTKEVVKKEYYKEKTEHLLQPYKAFCHGFCRNNSAKTTPILRFAQARL